MASLALSRFPRVLATQTKRRLGTRLQTWIANRLLAQTTKPVLILVVKIESSPDLTQLCLVAAAVRLGHLLLLNGVHARETANGLAEIDRSSTFLGKPQQLLESVTLRQKNLMKLVYLLSRQLARIHCLFSYHTIAWNGRTS